MDCDVATTTQPTPWRLDLVLLFHLAFWRGLGGDAVGG
jgi:hypothetical protein